VREVNGQPVVFVTVGDAAFNIQNTIRFATGLEHDRGAGFGGVVALDGLTGVEIWRVSTRNAARPAAIFDDDKVYVTTSAGEFITLNAATGAQLGFTKNPGNGYAGLASPNWYQTTDNRKLVIYGTIRPRRILAMDVTNPANPVIAWEFTPPNAAANAPGDTSVAVDQDTGRVFTTVFSSIGGANSMQALALDATTGAQVWMTLMGEGDNPPGFKSSDPMIHDGVMYAGNTINATFQALDAATGAVLWVTDLSTPGDQTPQRARAAAVFVEGVGVIHASGRHIRTFDPDSGAILNDFLTVGYFAIFGISQPVVVGDQMYLSSISGWAFGMPVSFVTTHPGFTAQPPEIPLPPRFATFVNNAARPTASEAGSFPDKFKFYAGGPTNNAVKDGPDDSVSWQTPLTEAVPLTDPPLDETIYGTEEATLMTHLEFGVGSGLAAAGGIIFAGSDRYSVHALNAFTGQEIWRFRTLNANFGQPLVTPTAVIISGGDQYTDLGGTGSFSSGAAFAVGASSQHYVMGLDPLTGRERWVFYTGGSTSGMTPLYYAGNLLWVDGGGKLNAVNASTGEPVAPYMDADGKPVLDLGFNAISCANVFRQNGNNRPDLLIVGTARPNQLTAVNLDTGAVAWTQNLAAFNTASTGFAASSVAVKKNQRRIVGTVLIDADPVTNTATVLAYGLDARTGAVSWTRDLGNGAFPLGFVAPTPVINGNLTFIANPLNNTVSAIKINNGQLHWQTPVLAAAGRMSWGPGVVVDKTLIQPIGPDLVAFDANKGTLRNWYPIGGSTTYNNPVVVGETLYIGNSFGWVSAIPVDVVVGNNINITDTEDEDSEDL